VVNEKVILPRLSVVRTNLSAEEFFLLDAPSVPNFDWEMKPVVVSS
jgi:hypothetical protein